MTTVESSAKGYKILSEKEKLLVTRRGEIARYEQFLLSPQCFQETRTFPKRQILDSSNSKEFADDIFKFNENGRKFCKRIENTVGKGEIALDEQFLLFPQCFQEICTVGT